jgi:cation diffusion facilitator CzcD-associated flavoprotein CzcO
VSGWITCVAVTRIALLLAHQSDVFAKKVLVIGSSQSALRIQNVINSSGGHLCQFVGNVVLSAGRNTQPALSAFDITELRRQRVWGVVLAKDTAESVRRESFWLMC